MNHVQCKYGSQEMGPLELNLFDLRCAMALVHSRIARVFYSVPMETGCLGTLYKIHSHASLNHHYKVFKNLLLDDPARTPFLHFPNLLDA
jgi:tRNA-specific adenosine deaminase 3